MMFRGVPFEATYSRKKEKEKGGLGIPWPFLFLSKQRLWGKGLASSVAKSGSSRR